MNQWKDPNGLNLLSLDAGGIRGASMLVILDHLMTRLTEDLVASHKLPENHPQIKPCEAFDMIGGSGMGGIIAILLGGLGVTVKEAIEAYNTISKHLYNGGYVQKDMGKKLQEAIQDTLEERGVPTDCHINDLLNKGKGCKTFVVATTLQNLAIPVLFRGYASRGSRGKTRSPNCSVWEAARATTAYRQLYPTIAIPSNGGRSATYVGAEYIFNNPTQCVVDEAKAEFRNKEILSLVSIGSGKLGPVCQRPIRSAPSFWKPRPQLKSGAELNRAINQIWEDCEVIACKMDRKLFEEEMETGYNPLTRLRVDKGNRPMYIDKMDLVEEVREHTLRSLQTPEVSWVVHLVVENMMRIQRRREFKGADS